MNAPNSTSTNPPVVAQPQTQTGMAPTPSDRTKEKPGEGPAASVLENRNHHRGARQEELPAPPNEENAKRNSSGAPSTSENAPTTTGATSGGSEPTGFYR